MVTLFPTKKTVFTNSNFLNQLNITWKNITGNEINQDQATLVWAKYSHETGGGADVWNFNIGNIKYIPPNLGNASGYMMLNGVWEIDSQGNKVVFNPPDPATWFRSYDNLASGINDYLGLLNTNRYKGAFQALLNGNLEDYAQKLHDEGYYTDTVANYTAGLKRWASQFPVNTFNQVISNSDNTTVQSDPTTNIPISTSPTSINTQPIPLIPDPNTDPIEVAPIEPTGNITSTNQNWFQTIINFFIDLFKNFGKL